MSLAEEAAPFHSELKPPRDFNRSLLSTVVTLICLQHEQQIVIVKQGFGAHGCDALQGILKLMQDTFESSALGPHQPKNIVIVKGHDPADCAITRWIAPVIVNDGSVLVEHCSNVNRCRAKCVAVMRRGQLLGQLPHRSDWR